MNTPVIIWCVIAAATTLVLLRYFLRCYTGRQGHDKPLKPENDTKTTH